MTIEESITIGDITEQNYQDYLGLGTDNDNILYKNFNPEEVVELEPEPQQENIFQIEKEFLEGNKPVLRLDNRGGWRSRPITGVEVILTNGEHLYFNSFREFGEYIGRTPGTAQSYVDTPNSKHQVYLKLGILSASRYYPNGIPNQTLNNLKRKGLI